MTEPILPRFVATTGRVDPSPLPQMTRSIAVGISLRCLPEQGAVGAEDERRAVQRPAVPLDHADDEMDGVVSGHRADGLGRLSGHLDGALEEAAEFVTPLRGPHPDADAEIVPLGIPGDERLGEDDEFGPLSGRIRREIGELLERLAGVEQDGSRLHDGHPHRLGAYSHRIGRITRHPSSSERKFAPLPANRAQVQRLFQVMLSCSTVASEIQNEIRDLGETHPSVVRPGRSGRRCRGTRFGPLPLACPADRATLLDLHSAFFLLNNNVALPFRPRPDRTGRHPSICRRAVPSCGGSRTQRRRCSHVLPSIGLRERPFRSRMRQAPLHVRQARQEDGVGLMVVVRLEDELVPRWSGSRPYFSNSCSASASPGSSARSATCSGTPSSPPRRTRAGRTAS